MDTDIRKRRLFGAAAVLGILAAAQLACSLTSGGSPQPGAATPKPGETAAADQNQPEATKESAGGGGAVGGGSAGGYACFGSKLNGATCLTADGWKSYTLDSGDLESAGFQNMEVCADGKIYGGTYSGIAVFDGKTWESISIGDTYNSADYLACAPDGSVWVGYYGGVARYAQGEWTMFTSDLYNTGDYSGSITGLAVAPDGTLWVATLDAVSSYDGSAWKEYRKGSGFDDDVSPHELAVDSKNRVFTVDYDTLDVFENGKWGSVKMGDFWTIHSLTVDPQDRVWVNTSISGIMIYNGSDWTGYSFQKGEIHSNGVYMAAFDKSGRTWLAMAYGIDVLSNGVWTHFRMDNADLVDNEFAAVAVVGDGPPLPAAMTKQTGSITGRVTQNDEPVANAEMEFCVEAVGGVYFGDTPCSDQPFFKKTTTDADGKFTVTDLPAGYYILTIKVNGDWISMGAYGTDRILVEEGRETDLEELTVNTD
jgi:hypothetical protein